MKRYVRQILLENFGLEGQLKLQNTSVLIVGSGGLGCPIATQLTAMGIGKLGIIDGDLVSLDNLHRQHLFTENDINLPKVEIVKKRLSALNSEIDIQIYNEFLSKKNANSVVENYDLVVDATDHIPTKFLINDTCIQSNKPWIHGALFKNEGQIAFFNTTYTGAINYRDLYEEVDEVLNTPSCEAGGILGHLPTLIGTLMTEEIIQWVIKDKSLLEGKILYLNTSPLKTDTFKISKNS
jgi:adenylyltransferase/sulfurtransferase